MPYYFRRTLPLFLLLFVASWSARAAEPEAPLTELRLTSLTPAAAALLAPPAAIATADLPKKPAPSPLFGDVLVRSAQAHLLGASLSGPRELTVLAYHAITDTWAPFGKVTLPGELITLRPAPAGFVAETRAATVGAPNDISRVELTANQRHLRTLDWVIIIGYLVFSTFI